MIELLLLALTVGLERIAPADYIIPENGTKLSYKCTAKYDDVRLHFPTSSYLLFHNLSFIFTKNFLINIFTDHVGFIYQRRWRPYNLFVPGDTARLGNVTVPKRSGTKVTKCYNSSCHTSGYESIYTIVNFTAHPNITSLICSHNYHFADQNIFRRTGMYSLQLIFSNKIVFIQ